MRVGHVLCYLSCESGFLLNMAFVVSFDSLSALVVGLSPHLIVAYVAFLVPYFFFFFASS